MATYHNLKSGTLHSAGKGQRTLCGLLNYYMVLRERGRKVTCKRCKRVLNK